MLCVLVEIITETCLLEDVGIAIKGKFLMRPTKWRWENITAQSFLKRRPIYEDSYDLNLRQKAEAGSAGALYLFIIIIFFTLGGGTDHFRRESPWHSINPLCTRLQIKRKEPNRLLMKKINLEKLLSGKPGHCRKTWVPVTARGLPGGMARGSDIRP